MGLFINAKSDARRPGVFAIETAPPRLIEGVSSGYIGFVGQFEWGPKQAVYTVASPSDFLDTFAPAGAPRTSTGYRALMGRRKLRLKVVRVLGAGSAAALDTLAATGGNIVSTAKYHGTLGNSISRTIAAAASGDATKRDFTFTLTDPVTGTTQEIYRDVPLPAGGVAVSVDVSASKLLASLVIAGTVTGWPANGTTTLATGSNGAAAGASDYTGTAGAADKGCALFELHTDVRVVVHDDCGNTNRAAINSGFATHAANQGDRLAVLEGDSDAADWTTVKGYVTGGLVSDRVIFSGAWTKVRDDAGALQTSPFSSFVASALINQDPQLSHARWADATTDLYAAIEDVLATFSTASETIQAEATEKGIVLPIRLESGRFAGLHDRTTSQTSGKKFAIRRRLTDFLAKSIRAALPSYVNSPNVVEQHREIKAIVDTFLREQVRQGRLVDFSTDIATPNTTSTVAAGEFTIAIDAKTPAPMEKIFLQLNAGETVTVREAA